MSYTPDGGVLWVYGDVHISGGTFNGMIIATGNVHISGGTINAPEDGFAIASESGNIRIQTSGTISGLIYAKNGDYTQTANGRVEGQIIINGEISKGGNSDIVVYKKYMPVNPNGSGNNGGCLVAGTWKEENITPP
jgi:cytoskeletal protein CcmA (bactofilin family)